VEEVLYSTYLKGTLVLKENGTWVHNGQEFTNEKLIDLFNRSIVWAEDLKEYVVQIGKGQAQFTYEDTVFFVLGLEDSTSPWKINLSDGSAEIFAPKQLMVGQQNQIYCLVKGSHRARFTRAAYQHLIRHLVDSATVMIDSLPVSLKIEKNESV